MFGKYIISRGDMWRRCLLKEFLLNGSHSKLSSLRAAVTGDSRSHFHSLSHADIYKLSCICRLHRKWYGKGLTDDNVTHTQVTQRGNEFKNITELFPLPRVTLNELAARTPQKIFDIHYKQNTVTPKGGRKKILQSGDWVCTYAFLWPEKIKFESTAISKRQSAEKAATQALHWLYENKRINHKGCPIYDKNVLEDIRSTLDEPIHITISDKSMERIDRIWNDYENGIKSIYEATFSEAKQFRAHTPALMKDSTIDDDDFSGDEASMDDEICDITELKMPVHPVYGRVMKSSSSSSLKRKEQMLSNTLHNYEEQLTPLPIDEYADQITATLENSRVVVIVGAAGCGKSTRVPVAVLRRWGVDTTAIVSEPRRVAAIGLAERVASELGEEVGDTVGYQVRLQSKPPRPPGGSILFCTSGVLLRRLQTNPGLQGCSHVFIDEAHERDVNTDLTLLLLKRALEVNPDLKIVIMSATLDTEVFTRYFDSCPVVEVPGRTFPVEVSYLDDIQTKYNVCLSNTLENCTKIDGRPHVSCQEVVEVIKAVDNTEKEGAILVFLPGWADIKQTKLLLERHYGESSLHLILPVHSRLSTADQSKMFATPPPGIRKIVLATNVAETSITIPDVVYVIDSGAHKENRIVERTGFASLETVWVSQAGARQRMGRAGRIQPGHCFKLYTKEKEMEFVSHTTPEVLRIPLEQTVLDCKRYAPEGRIEDFLSQLPEPPSKKAIQFAVNDLIDLGALTSCSQLSKLGWVLSCLSLHPRLGCVILHAAIMGGVLAASDVVTHCGGNIELFENAADRRDEVREIKSKYSKTSDHAALHWIQDEFERILDETSWKGVNEYCKKYGLRKERLNYVKSLSSLHIEQLLKSGVIEPTVEAEELNRFSNIDELTVAILLSGSNSLLTSKKHVKTKGKLATVVELFTSTGDRAHIGSESVNYGITKRTVKPSLLAYFGGYHSIERRALVVHKTSLIPPHTALLFCKGQIETTQMDEATELITMQNQRLKIHVPKSQVDHILKAREMLWSTLQYYVERNINNLDYDTNESVSRFKIRLVKALGKILVEGESEYLNVRENK